MFEIIMDLRLFANANPQTTTTNNAGNSVTKDMVEFLKRGFLENLEKDLVFAAEGDKVSIPPNEGKKFNVNRMDHFLPVDTNLQEGVEPDGGKINITQVSAELIQRGDYRTISDVLSDTAKNNLRVAIAERHGYQAGLTADRYYRDIVCNGTSRMFVPNSGTPVTARSEVTTGCLLTLDEIARATQILREAGAQPKEDGFFHAIITPAVERDLMKDSNILDFIKRSKPERFVKGYVGDVFDIRFIRSNNGKVIAPSPICGILPNRTEANAAVSSATDVYPKFAIAADDATAINAAITAGTVYKLYLAGSEKTISSVTGGAVGTAKFTLSASVTCSAGATICGPDAGSTGAAVQLIPVFGKGAFTYVDWNGQGTEYIYHDCSYGGALEQWETQGWKAYLGAMITNQAALLRIECSTTGGMTAISN